MRVLHTYVLADRRLLKNTVVEPRLRILQLPEKNQPILFISLRITQAYEFLKEFYAENKNQKLDFDQRWYEISEELGNKRKYDLTFDELQFGATTAWRNAPRCSGRSVWKSLRLRDCRHVQDVEQMFKELCIHIKEGSNGGIIVPLISIFPARNPDGTDPLRIWNKQLLSYAGYKDGDNVIGDRINLSFTDVSISKASLKFECPEAHPL